MSCVNLLLNKMTCSWVYILFFSTMYVVQPQRKYSYSSRISRVHQADNVLCVDIGDSVTLLCCVSEAYDGVVIWYKQPNKKPPQIMIKTFQTSTAQKFNEFHNPRFQVARSLNCTNMTITNIAPSDEAMYYCAIISPNSVFGNGTYLKIKETSKPAVCDNSVMCGASLNRNNININTPEKTDLIRSLDWMVLGLGIALGLCALGIFSRTYFLLRRRTSKRMKAAVENSSAVNQVSDAETLNYAAVKFTKKKSRIERNMSECLYSEIKM